MYLVMPALCNCSLSHWSTILFCNTNNTHSILIHSFYSIDFFFLFTPPLPPTPLVLSQISSLWKAIPPPKSSSQLSHPLPTTSHPSTLLTLEFPCQQFLQLSWSCQYISLTSFHCPSPLLWPCFSLYPEVSSAHYYRHFPTYNLNLNLTLYTCT